MNNSGNSVFSFIKFFLTCIDHAPTPDRKDYGGHQFNWAPIMPRGSLKVVIHLFTVIFPVYSQAPTSPQENLAT